tara:strand:+ start:290 stop:400 length:111 start_codon:yes stop_codon:yes gene_type:complete
MQIREKPKKETLTTRSGLPTLMAHRTALAREVQQAL